MNRACRIALLSLIAAGLLAGQVAAGEKGAERTRTASHTLGPKQAVFLENLLGAIEVVGGKGNTLGLEARVFAEGESEADAEALAETVKLETEEGADGLHVRVAFPVEHHASYRLPDAAKSARWYMDLLHGVGEFFTKDKELSAEYGGQTVRMGKGKEAVALAVRLRVTLPQGRAATVRQAFGEIRLASLRSNATVRCERARVLTEQLYGNLAVEACLAPVTVHSFQGSKLEVRGVPSRIELVNVRAGSIDLKAGTGRVEGQGVQADKFSVEAAEGDIALEDFAAVDFDIAATLGDVKLAPDLSRTKQGKLRTQSGEIRLKLGGFLPFALTARSDSGSVSGSGPAVVVDADGKHAASVRRGRGGATLEAACTSCDIAVVSR
ncbi:MAG TPA: DUF4097 family beta strand repeat-containing protein [Candidatus Polarisedimenticolaceae bacterium]|nr:DUF4097 family beta strand repeat-containing protein [Candidatus Polarisedimenticolaceae bacterium]